MLAMRQQNFIRCTVIAVALQEVQRKLPEDELDLRGAACLLLEDSLLRFELVLLAVHVRVRDDEKALRVGLTGSSASW